MADQLLTEDGNKLLLESGGGILLKDNIGWKPGAPPIIRKPKLQFRRGTTAEWAAQNPVLALGEPGVDLTTGDFKIGDGATAWLSLPLKYAPLWLTNNLRGFVADGIAYNPAPPITAAAIDLTGSIMYTFDPTRRYRVSFVLRAMAGSTDGAPGGPGGSIQFWVWSMTAGVQLSADQITSADPAFYHGGYYSWLITPSGTHDVRIRTTGFYTSGMYVYGRDFYIEDVGAI